MFTRRPLLAGAVVMAGAILFTYRLGEGRLIGTVVFVAVFALAACVCMPLRRPREGAVLLLCMVCFAAGSFLFVRSVETVQPPASDVVSGRVEAVERTSSGKRSYLLADLQCIVNDEIVHVPGRALVYGLSSTALPGQKLTLDGAYLQIPDESANPGERNARTQLWTRGATYTVLANRAYPTVTGRPNAFRTGLYRVRENILDRIDDLFPRERDAAMMRALVLGDLSQFDDDVYENFRNLGIVHVIAVSGMHVGYIAALLLAFFRAAFMLVPNRYGYLWGKYRAIRSIFVAAFLLFYAALTGFTPSILRATVMTLVLLFAGVVGRRRDLPNAIALSALVVMILRPADVFSLSAQLSYGAVIGIHLYSRKFTQRFPKKTPKYLSESLSVSTAAQIGILPPLAYSFGQIPFLGILANLFAIPISGLALMIVIPIIFISYPLPGLAAAFAIVPAFLSRLLEGMAAGAASLPGTYVEIAAPSALLVVAYYAAFFVFAQALPVERSKFRRVAVCSAALLLCFSLAHWGLSLYPRAPEATVLSVGGGQAAILRHKDQLILIDGGPASSNAAFDFSKNAGQAYDAVVLTDYQNARTGALAGLIKAGRVQSLYLPTERFEDDLAALSNALAAGIPVRFYSAGDVLPFGELYVRSLPLADESFAGKTPAVLSVEGRSGQSLLLIMGSLSPELESAFSYPQTKLLVAPNRGAYESCGEMLLRAIGAEAAVFPCGASGLGASMETTYNRIAAFVPSTYRTDQSGAVTFRFGSGITISAFKNER